MGKKIIHINFADKTGGAAIAAFRHNEALNKIGYTSKLLVISKTSNASTVIKPKGRAAFVKLKSRLYSSIANLRIQKYYPYATFSNQPLGFDISDERSVKEADVIVLHWVCNGMVSIRGIEKILSLGKPVIWFLHDMWPMTGGCHYSLGCEYYEGECHNCPLLFNRQGSAKKNDISYRYLNKKIEKWSHFDNLYIMAPSKWLADCAKRSSVFKNLKITVFRNVIDTAIFKPVNKELARKVLNLPLDKKLILFGADSISSPYKGWSYLKVALDHMNDLDVECVLFGNSNSTLLSLESTIKINYVGRLNDDVSLTLLYNACDVFVTPSIADNYPNVILEAMACGLPCVGFNVGGIPEMINHKVTGYVSNNLSPEGLLEGIKWVIYNANLSSISYKARQYVIEESSYISLEWNIAKNSISTWIK